jgi:hypothetical protein
MSNALIAEQKAGRPDTPIKHPALLLYFAAHVTPKWLTNPLYARNAASTK